MGDFTDAIGVLSILLLIALFVYGLSREIVDYYYKRKERHIKRVIQIAEGKEPNEQV